jgi:PAS domain-containing protein
MDLLQDMFEALGQILWFLRPDGSVERFNSAWAAYTGRPARVEGLTWAEVFHPDDRQRLVQARTAGVTSAKPYAFAFVTGFEANSTVLERFQGVPVVAKPFATTELVDTVDRLTRGGRSH